MSSVLLQSQVSSGYSTHLQDAHFRATVDKVGLGGRVPMSLS